MDTTTVWLLLGALVVLLLAGTAAVLLVRVLRARKLLTAAGIPLRDKALVWAAVIYTVSPVDLLPDPIYLDDIGFLLLALRSLHASARAVGVGTRTAVGTPEAPGEKRNPAATL
ncbi:YkvA family protein [Streptomyces sp. NBC_01754]|uniref:YkvA family protein n=1 Tax=Streptomyces sp. NBC_01754 TaxID=2975930 RepID=UPI002DD9A9A8|nr:YkvA family protein [Streptomyces sp. NBC_01754]WSC91117.1 YkvA family protein [Streptomyces sp. NBC_01754]